MSDVSRTIKQLQNCFCISNSIDNGYIHIKCEIKNISNDTLSFVEVKSHFYDKNMNIIDIENGFTDPTDLSPGQTGNFDVMLMKDRYGSTPPTFFKLSYDWR